MNIRITEFSHSGDQIKQWTTSADSTEIALISLGVDQGDIENQTFPNGLQSSNGGAFLAEEVET